MKHTITIEVTVDDEDVTTEQVAKAFDFWMQDELSQGDFHLGNDIFVETMKVTGTTSSWDRRLK